MKQRFVFLLRTYALTVLLFLLAKVVFMVCNASGHDVSVSDYFDVLRHGLSLDLSTALYFIAVPLLVSLVSLWVKVSRWVLTVYFAIISFAFALAFVADTSLYPFWGFKLDASCLQYLSQPEGITQSVSVGYLLLRFILVAALTAGIFLLYKAPKDPKDPKDPPSCVPSVASDQRSSAAPEGATIDSTLHGKTIAIDPTLNSKTIEAPSGAVGGAPGAFRPGAFRSRVLGSFLHILLLPLLVIGIRGGLGESTTNIGQVYYSQNQFLNHASVNPVFSFLYSLSHQLGDLSQYDFMDEDECRRLTDNVYTTESVLADTLLTTTRPNIVIILLESAGEEFAEAMPHLQQLKHEGINFSRCYANSWRTDRGTVCALSGYPSFPSVSVMKMPEKSRTLPSIASTLQRQGYQTTYLYGGDINFTNMRSYLIGTGWERLISMDDYSSSDRQTAQWGVRDDITFNTLYQEIANAHQSKIMIGYSTLSSHEPWDVPTKKLDDEAFNAFAYVDDCLYDFVQRLRQTPAWNDLLIVITADHGINYGRVDQSTPLQKNHIPMLWIGGAVKEPRTIGSICNQSDMAATLLGQLQLPHADFTFSRDVLSATYVYPMAVHNYYNAQWVIDSTGHALYDFDASRFIVSDGPDAERLLRVGQAMLQLTIHDLQQR